MNQHFWVLFVGDSDHVDRTRGKVPGAGQDLQRPGLPPAHVRGSRHQDEPGSFVQITIFSRLENCSYEIRISFLTGYPPMEEMTKSQTCLIEIQLILEDMMSRIISLKWFCNYGPAIVSFCSSL